MKRPPKSLRDGVTEVAAALRREKKVIVTCHVKPDGDALGCLIAMHRAMQQLGADSVMYIADTGAFAPEYAWLPGLSEAVVGVPPGDAGERSLITVDCGSAERVGDEDFVKAAGRVINIDHHADNTRFGDLNLVAGDASSTAEILFYILEELAVEFTPDIGVALYTGVLVDSGRFQYASATASTFRVAADLIEGGVDHTEIFHRVYETVPLAKARLLCRLLTNMTIVCEGRLAIGVLRSEDFEWAGAASGLTEGLVDSLRAIDGVLVAALVYARPADAVEAGQKHPGRPHFRVSLRSSSEELDVQQIARKRNGGGHKQASGYTAEDETPEEIIAFLTDSVSQILPGD